VVKCSVPGCQTGDGEIVQRHSRPAHCPPAAVLLLTASTGAGHDSTAEALAAALHAALPGARVSVCDVLRRGARDTVLRADRWYDLVVAQAPRLWGLFYQLTNHEGLVRLSVAVAALLWGPRLRAALHAERPDLVVSVHPLCARLVVRALRDGPASPPHHCVVTDLVTVHRCWAAPGVAAFYVATRQAAAALVAAGIPSARIHVTGLPVRCGFSGPPSAPPGGPQIAVLLLGGGRATGALAHAACMLLASRLPLRLVVVCGRNEHLRRRLAALGHGRATVLGWRDDVAALMRASNVVVTKAGSATLAEAFSQARPVVTYQALCGQEEGNVALLEQEGLGRHVADVAALPVAVVELGARDATRCAAERACWWAGAAARVVDHLVAVSAATRLTVDHRGLADGRCGSP
jgi:UDP-N-acetylglucosamine:LPS N-acetylglucosamine transferase